MKSEIIMYFYTDEVFKPYEVTANIYDTLVGCRQYICKSTAIIFENPGLLGISAANNCESLQIPMTSYTKR